MHAVKRALLMSMTGSMNMSYDSSNLTTPDIKWLGVRPSDLDRFSIPQQCRLPMTDEDIKTGKRLVSGFLFASLAIVDRTLGVHQLHVPHTCIVHACTCRMMCHMSLNGMIVYVRMQLLSGVLGRMQPTR